MGIAYNTSIVRSGLVLHLDAANIKSYPGSGTAWNDMSGRSGSGVLTNSPVFNAAGYFTFDGASDYVRFTRSDLNAGTFAYTQITCNLWYKPSASGAGNVTANNLITVENSFEISVGNLGTGYHGINYASNPWAWYGTSDNVLKNDVWHMITFVHASTGRWLYVNGIQVFYQGDSGNVSAGTSAYPYLTLMGRYDGSGSQATGALASVTLYNRVLTVAEIKQNFEAYRGRYGI